MYNNYSKDEQEIAEEKAKNIITEYRDLRKKERTRTAKETRHYICLKYKIHWTTLYRWLRGF